MQLIRALRRPTVNKLWCLLLAMTLLLTVPFTGCGLLDEEPYEPRESGGDSSYSGGWLYEKDAPETIEALDLNYYAELEVQEAAPVTVMIVVNGSDLESEGGMATEDMAEMLASEFNEQNVNVLLLTGGTNEWQNDRITSDCGLYLIENGDFVELADFGDISIVDEGLIAGFINFGYEIFPAQQYSLFFWNHGGGSVLGYGVDELHDYDALSLSELEVAVASSAAASQPLELIGFDACLMANLETACVLSGYANYMVASEDLEPGYGWDYTFLHDLGEDPTMGGDRLGSIIADYFYEFYALNLPDESTTLSVMDLNQAGSIADAFDRFAEINAGELSSGGYSTIAKARGKTRSFGDMGAHGGDTDMIDIAHLAKQLGPLAPDESESLLDALDKFVLYSVHSDNQENVGGLSVYFPFAAKDSAPDYIETYKGIGVLPRYTNFIVEFGSILTGEVIAPIEIANTVPEQTEDGNYQIVLTSEELVDIYEIYFTVWQKEEDVATGAAYYIQLGENSGVDIADDGTVLTEFDGYWTALNGYWACLYEIDSSSRGKRYSIPALLNGVDVDLIALYNDQYPDGKILGAVPTTSDTYNMPAKNMLPIKDGDRITLYYYSELFATEDAELDESMEDWLWYEGDEFVVDGELVLEAYEADDGEYLYGFTVVDTQQNVWYTDFIELQIES